MADDVTGVDGGTPRPSASSRARRERKAVLLRLDPAVYDAVAAWAGQELRSVNAHVEWLLRKALEEAGRLSGQAGPRRGPDRPRLDGVDDSAAAG